MKWTPADAFSHDNLRRLFDQTPEEPLGSSDSIVVFSDIHLGDGGRTDDFLWNSELFIRVLREHYLPGGHTLILNGDIEELQRFSLASIMERWHEVYSIFDRFDEGGRLLRLVGNHDMDLQGMEGHGFHIRQALRYRYNDHPIFIFHGHQTSRRFERFNSLVGVGLRYFANPLRISNYSVAHDSTKRFRTEERVYEFASGNQVLSVIGHTHRPLFESMSKIDSIKFEIERLCRKYPKSSERKKAKIETSIDALKLELRRVREDDENSASVASLYNASFLVPCMFNSGTVIGKRGMTCLEIDRGRIALVHWFDQARSRKYLQYTRYSTTQLPGTGYHRVVIKEDSLDYVFARIRLLAG